MDWMASSVFISKSWGERELKSPIPYWCTIELVMMELISFLIQLLSALAPPQPWTIQALLKIHILSKDCQRYFTHCSFYVLNISFVGHLDTMELEFSTTKYLKYLILPNTLVGHWNNRHSHVVLDSTKLFLHNKLYFFLSWV